MRKGYNLRNLIPVSLAETPPTPRALPSYLRKQQKLTCPSIDEDEEYNPDASASQSAAEMLQESLRQSTLDLARLIDIDPATIHFTNNFRSLASSTQRKRVNIARKVAFAICRAFAPDDPKYFEQLLRGGQSLQSTEADIQAKLDNIVSQVLECFQNATTATARQQALSLIAPFLELSEIRAYFPDISPYYFKRA